MNDETFTGWIQLHERAWGTDQYEDRPSLHEMMNAPVLVFWYPQKGTDRRFTAGVFANMQEVNKYATTMLLECKFKPPVKRLARLFIGGRRVRIRGVRVVYDDISTRSISGGE